MKLFDYNGFYDYYMAKSKYEKKKGLVETFWREWKNKFGGSNSLTYACGISVRYINELWTVPNKKDLKVKLISRGYSSQSIDSLFKCFTDWLKASK